MGRDDRFPVLTIWLLIVVGAVQLIVWFYASEIPGGYRGLLPAAISWLTLLLLAALVTRRASAVQSLLTRDALAQRATLQEVDELRRRNEILRIVGHAIDVPEAFQALAPHIERFVACDRIGLALLSDDHQEFQTFTARPPGAEARTHPRQAMVFSVDGTALGQVVRTGQAVLLDDTRNTSAGYLDAIVLSGSGFHSALLVPLITDGRPVGTLNLVSRRASGFRLVQAQSVSWIAEILAAAWVAQQTQVALGRLRTLQAMSELALSTAAETNSALQAIIGHCDLIRREYQDDRLRRDIDTVTRQAERIAQLLSRMRVTTQDRLQEISAIVGRADRPEVDVSRAGTVPEPRA